MPLVERKTYAKFLATIPDAALVVDRSGRIAIANEAACELFGYPTDKLTDLPLDALLPDDVQTGHQRHLKRFFATPTRRNMGDGRGLHGIRADGTDIPVQIMLSSIELENDTYAVAIVRDDSERKLSESRMQLALEAEKQHALSDSLTKLANRRAFNIALENHMRLLNDYHVSFALAYLDLDNFKQVNDTQGHLAGDELLRKFGRSIEQLSRSRDLVARLGGDEFAIILADSDASQAALALERIRQQVVQLFARHQWPVTVSIGWIFCDSRVEERSLTELMMAADSAMYQAKAAGKNDIVRADVG